jgi:hypothetical protein
MTTTAPIPLTPLPKRADGRTDWGSYFATAATGARLHIRDTHRSAALGAARRGPHRCITHKTGPGTTLIIIGEARPPLVSPRAAKTGPFQGLTPADVTHKITDAEEQLQYWTRRRASESLHIPRIQAGARIEIWTQHLAALRHYLTLIS